jgi:TolA-binding protein
MMTDVRAKMIVLACCFALAGWPGAGKVASAPEPGRTAGRVKPPAAVQAANALTRLARQDFEAGRFAAAAGRLQDLLKGDLEPVERAEVYVLLCESRLRQGELALAESVAVQAKTAGGIQDEAALQRLSFLGAEILYFSGDAKRATDEYISFLEDNLESPFVNDAVERLLLIDENSGPGPRPLAAYARAELAQLAGAPDSALAILDGILRDPSLPPISDDALAKKADILRGLRKFSDAVTQYRLVEARFPQSRLVPGCKLKIAGLYAAELDDKEKAVAECEEITQGFPGTSYAVEARALLNKLTSGGPGGLK